MENILKTKKKLHVMMYLRSILVFLFLLILDQFTKNLAVKHLCGKSPFVIIKGVFELQYLQNYGAAFGIMQNQLSFLIPLTIVISILGVYIFTRIPFTKRFEALRWTLYFFMAGAIGNFIDRISLGYVVDFLYFKLIDFPIFNVADIYITCSCIVLILLMFFYYKDEDLEQIKWFQKRS